MWRRKTDSPCHRAGMCSRSVSSWRSHSSSTWLILQMSSYISESDQHSPFLTSHHFCVAPTLTPSFSIFLFTCSVSCCNFHPSFLQNSSAFLQNSSALLLAAASNSPDGPKRTRRTLKQQPPNFDVNCFFVCCSRLKIQVARMRHLRPQVNRQKLNYCEVFTT